MTQNLPNKAFIMAEFSAAAYQEPNVAKGIFQKYNFNMPERSIQELENLFKNYNSNSKWNFFNKKIANSYFLQLKTIAKLFNKTTENIRSISFIFFTFGFL